MIQYADYLQRTQYYSRSLNNNKKAWGWGRGWNELNVMFEVDLGTLGSLLPRNNTLFFSFSRGADVGNLLSGEDAI